VAATEEDHARHKKRNDAEGLDTSCDSHARAGGARASASPSQFQSPAAQAERTLSLCASCGATGKLHEALEALEARVRFVQTVPLTSSRPSEQGPLNCVRA
jgi:hypothetical protein